MKIGGYSHTNGITFFCDLIKIKSTRKGKKINYDIEWIVPPKFLRRLENKVFAGGLLVIYYQWKVLGKKMKSLFLFLIGFYMLDLIVDLSFIDKYLDYILGEKLIYLLIAIFIILILNYKKILSALRYHGAEHKAINSYINHGYVNNYLMSKASRFNKRCGSNIASLFLILYIPIWILNIDSIFIVLTVFLISIQITKILAQKECKWDKYINILQWVTALEPRQEEVDLAVLTFNKLQEAYYIYQKESRKNIEIV